MFNAAVIVSALLENDELDAKRLAMRTRMRGPYAKSEDKFHNRDGSLTNYAFACGYIQDFEAMGVKVELWKEGGWHVRAHDHHAGRRLFWETFDNKGDAVRRYRQEVRRLSAQQNTGLRETLWGI